MPPTHVNIGLIKRTASATQSAELDLHPPPPSHGPSPASEPLPTSDPSLAIDVTVRTNRGRGLACLGMAVFVFVTVYFVAPNLGLGPVDDAFISLRYATQWAAGQGLCFNSGERVEGYTNFLLVLIQAAAIRGGLDPLVTLRIMPALAMAILAGVVLLFASKHLAPRNLQLACLMTALVVLHPIMVCWATAGLESCLVALLLLGGILPLVAEFRPRRMALSAVLLILAGMTRPDAAALYPALVICAYFKRRKMSDAIAFGSAIAIGFGAYFACRAIYFGQLFPNTFYAKLDYGNQYLLARGRDHALSFLLAAPLPVLLCIAALVHVRAAPLWVKAFAAVIATQFMVVIYEGGDHFAMYRFFVPIIPLVGLLAMYPCVVLARRRSSPRIARLAVPVGMATLALSAALVCKQSKADESKPVTQYGRFLQEADCARQWSAVGRFLGRRAVRGESLATVAIGAVGHYSDLRIVDPHGLIDPAIARKKSSLGTGYAGHEKYDVAHVLAQRPGYILLVNYLTLESISESEIADHLWGPFNRKLHADPRLAQDYRYENIPLAGRWLNIHVRRDLTPL